MIYEELDIKFDYPSLRKEFETISQLNDPVMLTSTFGGWSITSSDGDYRDGWLRSNELDCENVNLNFNPVELKKKYGLKSVVFYKTPTQVCGLQAKSLIDRLEDLGFYPRRVRYMLLKAGGQSNLHRDAPDEIYSVRLHVPIVNNPDCFFECEEGRANLKPGCIYLLKVNRPHQVVNKGSTDRVHLVCDVFDTKGYSQFHKLTLQDREKLLSLKQQNP